MAKTPVTYSTLADYKAGGMNLQANCKSTRYHMTERKIGMGYASHIRKAVVMATLSLFTAQAAGAAQSCNAQVGEDEAQTYVDQCLEVSPATHPPCNGENPCQMMWDEIARSCAMLGKDAPGFCSDY